jgi:hypothetical protein
VFASVVGLVKILGETAHQVNKKVRLATPAS